MDRREFIRVVGGTALTASVAPGYALDVQPGPRPGVLLETASFADRGGWALDTQHHQQMGGCYLLAHGLGKPVAPARTRATLPESGSWNVWVRTRDWCPGDWEPPGRFRVRINGADLPVTFGTEPGWAWQRGGPVDLTSAGEVEVEVELHDLTGFDGRCDALFFSKDARPMLPNDDLVALAAWKDQVSGRGQLPVEERSFDLVIVGGGIAGCAAALAATAGGLKVALIQDRPLFGGNASEEVRVHTLGIHGRSERILKTINTEHYPNGSSAASTDQRKRETTLKESGVELFPLHLCCGLEKDGERIVCVEAREATTGRLRRFRAPTFIDCTGDGWLGHWAGAECRYGREAAGEFDEGWDEHGELWSPVEPDHRVMGSSILWNSRRTGRPSAFPDVPWAMPVAGSHAAIEGEWYWEYSANNLHQVADGEHIRDHLLRAIYGSFANAKRDPQHANVALAWVAFVAGKRESRRIMGDYVYTMRDVTELRRFPDTVVEEERDIDAHHQLAETQQAPDFLSKALFFNPQGIYHVPFRCLCARDLSNLMMAGRCFSCSHIGLCGPRVMNTCGQMGVATGFAAALCRKHHCSPHEVGKQYIAELRRMIGYA